MVQQHLVVLRQPREALHIAGNGNEVGSRAELLGSRTEHIGIVQRCPFIVEKAREDVVAKFLVVLVLAVGGIPLYTPIYKCNFRYTYKYTNIF